MEYVGLDSKLGRDALFLRELKVSNPNLFSQLYSDPKYQLILDWLNNTGCKQPSTLSTLDKRITKSGYVVIKVDGCWYLEHRRVWERANGKLPEGWIVHHKNGIRTDNRLENLTAIGKKDHSFLTQAEVRYKRQWIQNKVCIKETAISIWENILQNYQKENNMPRRKMESFKIGYVKGRYVDINGYVMVKTDRGWMHEHRYIWEKVNGTIPEGHIIKFKDSNRENTSIENLYLVPRRQKITDKDAIIADLQAQVDLLLEEIGK